MESLGGDGEGEERGEEAASYAGWGFDVVLRAATRGPGGRAGGDTDHAAVSVATGRGDGAAPDTAGDGKAVSDMAVPSTAGGGDCRIPLYIVLTAAFRA